MNLGENLRKIRKDNNLSQEDLADLLKVSRQSVSKWESGIAYPEMDKILLICKKFNIKVDELLNEDLNEVKEDKERKININKYIEEITKFIMNSTNMIINMSFKDKCKLLFEEAKIAFLLFIISTIIILIINIIFHSLLSPFEYAYRIVDIISSISITIVIVLDIIIMLNLYKTRYLDYYEYEEKKKELPENIDVEEKISKKEKVIIYRDQEHSGFKFINGILKIALIFIKGCVLLFGTTFLFTLITLLVCLVFSLLIIKSGLTFIGIFLMIISSIVINVLILYIIYRFIISKKLLTRNIFIIFITSLIVFGLSIGITLVSTLNYKEVKEYNKSQTTTIPMNDKYSLTLNYDNIIWEVEDREDIEIDAKYNDILNYKFQEIECDDEIVCIHLFKDNSNFNTVMKAMKKEIDKINNKQFMSIGTESYEVTIKASKENIKILKDNMPYY